MIGGSTQRVDELPAQRRLERTNRHGHSATAARDFKSAQSIDLVLLVMNASARKKMLRNRVSLGAEVSLAAGLVGRDARAAIDAQLKAEILSCSRTQGSIAGVNLSRDVVRADKRTTTWICTARA